ncbi:MAG: TRAP transporter small permease [Beijerinckiaceae bacterium]
MLERITTIIEQIAGYFIGILAIITFTAAVLRYVFNSFIPDGFIVAQTLQGIAICWGIGTAIYADRHITVDLIYASAGQTYRRICDVTAQVLNLLFMVLFAYASVFKVFDIRAAGEISDDLRFPLWFGYSLAMAGIVAALLLAGIRTWQVIFAPDQLQRNEGGH